MRKKRRALVLASVILMLAMLSGCASSSIQNDAVGGVDEQSKTNDTVNNVDAFLNAKQWVDALETVDYENYEFIVATTRETVFLTDEDASSIVDEAKILRNDMVEEKFNIKIVERLYEAEDLLPEQSTAALVNTSIADIVACPAEQMSVLASNGLLLNLYSVPYLNMNAKYVTEALRTQYTANNTAYMMYDDLVSYQTNIWAVFYNVDLMNTLGLEDPYSYVKNGTWTWDVLLEMAKKVLPAEENEDESVEALAEDDSSDSESGEVAARYYGLASYYNGESDLDLAYAMLGSMGQRYFGDSYRQNMTLSLDVGVANKAVDMFLEIVGSELHYGGSGMDAITEFTEGNLLFYVYETSLAAALANSKTEWSVAPLPKGSEEQESYCSWIDTSAVAIGVFNTNTNTPRVGRILNCLCAASYEHIREATDTAYINYYLRNNQSAVSLTKYVFNNPFVDVTYLYGMGIEELRVLTYEKLAKTILEGDKLEKELFDEENKALAEQFAAEMFK